MTFEEKKSLRDELKGTANHERRKKILSRLNYPRMDGTMHADEIKAAWSKYWGGNPPHPNFDWGKGGE